MVEILLILFAIAAYYVALQWFYDGCKTKNNDSGGKIFGSIIFLIITGLVVCFFLDFLYPVVVMLGILSFVFIVIGLDFLSQDSEVFCGSSKMFGVLPWVLGLIAAYPTLAIMLREGWYTVSACVVSGFMVISGLLIVKRYIEKMNFSYPSILTFACLLFASFFITYQYPVIHHAVVITDVVISLIVVALMYWRFKPLEFST